jgi:peroxiredoxin
MVFSIVPLGLLLAWGARAAAANPALRKLPIGQKVPDFTLPDVSGRAYSLHKLRRKKAVVVIFISVKCPTSKAFNRVMAKLAREYTPRAVDFLAIDANKTDSLTDVTQFARDQKLGFPVLRDEGNVVADRWGAARTPEAFLLDRGLILRYHGALGNSHSPTTNPANATDSDIRPALDAVLAGQAVAVSETKAFG